MIKSQSYATKSEAAHEARPQVAGGPIEQTNALNMANTITILRFPLLFLVVVLLIRGNAAGRQAAVALTLLLILMDTLDGVVARWRQETTLLGSALDVATDRAVELVLWVVFAHLALIPITIPLIVIVRGVLTDSIRAVGLQHGVSAHGMMQTNLGKWLVASPPMRTGYAIVKIVAFIALASTVALQASGMSWATAQLVGLNASWAAVAFCLLRGLPVLAEARGYMNSLEARA